jgi:hypothetical protein
VVSASPISLPTWSSITARHYFKHFPTVLPKLTAFFGVSRVGLILKEAT